MAEPAQLSDGDLARLWAGGDPGAFAEAYRRFAPALFGTAVGLLGDRTTAADVVHDTFVRAAPRVGGLREPDRLRAWLFAILRNEAATVHRDRRHDGGSLDDASGGTVTRTLADDATPADVLASQSELAALVWDAADGLQDRDREVLELNLRGGLETPDLADALGVTPGHAAVLLSRMRDRLERCLGALILARVGRKDCDALDRLLDGWDGRFSLQVRSTVSRHVEGCPRCSEQRTAMVSLERLAPAIVPPAVLLPTDLHARLVASLSDLGRGAAACGAAGPDAAHAAVEGWDWRSDGFPEQVANAVRRPAADAGAAAGGAAGGAALLGAAGEWDGELPPSEPAAGVPAVPVPRSGEHRGRRPLGAAASVLVVALPLLVAGAGLVIGNGWLSPTDSVAVALETPEPTPSGGLSSPVPSPDGDATPTASADPVATSVPTSRPSGSTATPTTDAPTTTPTGSRTPKTRTTTPTTTSEPDPEPDPETSTTRTRTTDPTPTGAAPAIQRVAVSPSALQVQSRACKGTSGTLTVIVKGSGVLKVKATWHPGGVEGATQTDQLQGSGDTYSGPIGPYTVVGSDEITVEVTDAYGRTDTRSTKVAVEGCAAG